MAQLITLYGSQTCEDTAVTRNHLEAQGIPFKLMQREQDPTVDEAIRRYNNGNINTPIVVIGEQVASEPALEQLDEMVRAAGYVLHPTTGDEFRALSGRPSPDFTLPSSDDTTFTLHRLRGRRKSVLFFAHDNTCRVCAGYARQLLRHKTALTEYDSQMVLILKDDVEGARHWSHEFVDGYPTLADEGGKIKQQYGEYFNYDPNGVFLLVLDSYTAPRAGSFSPDAGGLIVPHEVLEWLRLLDSECAE